MPDEKKITAKEAYTKAMALYKEKQYTEAIPGFQQAAEMGSLFAMFQLGQMHEDGIGVPQDFSQARSWYMKIYDTGDRAILDELHRLAWREQREKGSVPSNAIPRDEELEAIYDDAKEKLDDFVKQEAKLKMLEQLKMEGKAEVY